MVSSSIVEDYEEANQKLTQAIGIPSVGDERIDLTQYDPLQAAEEPNSTNEELEVALSAAQAAIQIGSIMVTANELGGDDSAVIESIADGVIESLDQGGDIRLQQILSESTSIENLLNSVTDNESITEVANNLAIANSEINQAGSLDDIVNEQTVLFRKVGIEIDTTAAPILGKIVATQVENTNTFEIILSRPPLENVMVNAEAKEAGLFEPSSKELYFNNDNWDQPQYITLFKSGQVPITEQLSTGIIFSINDELSSIEFRNQDILSVSFSTNIDR